MTDGHVQRIEEEAIAWVLRLREAGADDWEAFTLWLEADPAHQAAYDEAALADLEAEELAPAPRARRKRSRAARFSMNTASRPLVVIVMAMAGGSGSEAP